jgi:predicted HicB family RNase H-like nuclease
MSSNILAYKNYRARVEFDAEDSLFFGRIAGLNDGVTFHGESVTELVAAFQDAVNDYLATCVAIGKAPEKPYSGKLMIRVDPQLHALSVEAAELAGVSFNQWAESLLRREVERRDLAA